MRRLLVTAVVLLLAQPAVAGARPGELDRSFSGDGLSRIVTPAEESVPADAVVDVRGGTLVQLNGSRVLRVTPGGRLDPRWGTEGVAVVPSPGADGNGRPAGIAALPDGGVVVFQSVTLGRFVVARLRADGTPDPAFGDGDGAVELDPAGYAVPLEGMVVRPDGSLRVAAIRTVGPSAEPVAPPPEVLVVGLEADGDADPRFGQAGVVRIPVAERALAYPFGAGRLLTAPDGSLNVVASVTQGLVAGLESTSGLVAHRRDGFLPSRSGSRGASLDAAGSPDGGLFVWGGDGPTLLRLNADFSIDTRFRPRRLPRSAGTSPDVLALGEGLLLAGTRALDAGKRTYRVVTSVVALDATGKLDRTFGSRGRTTIALRGRAVGRPSVVRDRVGRLIVVSNFGDGLSSIRDDFGRDDPLVARVRLADPALDVRGTTVAVSRTGRVAVRLRCRGAVACAATLRLRGGGLRERGRVRLRPGARRTVHLAAGRRARSLASRGRTVTVALRADGLPGDAVDRPVRLRAG